MRRSTSVQLVLLPMLATAAVASAQPGPQDSEPPPPPAPGEPGAPGASGEPDDGTLAPPGMTEPELAPPGLTAVDEGAVGEVVLCDDPATWPPENQELGVPPYACRAVYPRCDDPATWTEREREIGVAPIDCERRYGAFTVHANVIRGGFGHYFGTGGG